MMADGAEEGQLKGPIDVLAPYTSPSKSSCFATRLRSCEDRWRVRHCGPWIEQSSLD
jgi:hypothetical protein